MNDLLGDESGRQIGLDDDILNDGTVDSLGVMRLVAFVETETEIAIPPEDLILENFQSINSIGDYLDNRTS